MFVWLHFKVCSHGKSWPCKQPEGFISCEPEWTIGKKDGTSYYIIGSDEIYQDIEFDKIISLTEQSPV